MSMSQEEIESLMNGLDIAEDDASDVAAGDVEVAVEEPTPESTPEVIPEVFATEAPEPEPVVPEVPAAPAEEMVTIDNDSIDDLINNLDNVSAAEESVETDDIDELLNSIDQEPVVADEEIVDSSDIDDLIASLDNVSEEKIEEIAPVEEAPVVEAPVVHTPVVETIKEEAAVNLDNQIENGVFPLPADAESKVVSQLSQVATDSEEKATKIFDVLSFILDENMAIEGSVTKMSKFLEEQEKVLKTLTVKFPNVDVFSSNLEMLNALKDEPQKIKDSINKENNELFAAMELMQYHDINRQKIERVMSVIRKLSNYLNNIFEDDNSHEEIAVAKHISGDSSEDLVDDADMDALIAEFGN